MKKKAEAGAAAAADKVDKITAVEEKNTDEKENELTIEECLDKLDVLLEDMENSDTGLEETFKLYEQGLKLIKRAESGIDKVEKQLKILDGEE